MPQSSIPLDLTLENAAQPGRQARVLGDDALGLARIRAKVVELAPPRLPIQVVAPPAHPEGIERVARRGIAAMAERHALERLAVQQGNQASTLQPQPVPRDPRIVGMMSTVLTTESTRFDPWPSSPPRLFVVQPSRVRERTNPVGVRVQGGHQGDQ